MKEERKETRQEPFFPQLHHIYIPFSAQRDIK